MIIQRGRAEAPGVERLYAEAFPDEDLVPLVRQLSKSERDVVAFVASDESGLAGHVLFTMCAVDGWDGRAALLGPLAVAPRVQRSGVGSALVRAGLDDARKQGVARVFVLGDPAFYGRFGFSADARVSPPYDLPKAWIGAWQSVGLSSAENEGAGPLRVPVAWMSESLWRP
jgi:putative acetyltransferase